MRLDFQAVNRASKARFQRSVRSDVAYLPLGIHVEIESLRLDFHVLPTWMIDVEAPGNRVFETRFLIGLFQIFRLNSVTLTHSHTFSPSHKPKHSHSVSNFPTYIFSSQLLTKLSHFLSISHIHTHTHNHAGVEEQSPAQPSDDAEPSHRLLSSLSLATTPTPLSPSLSLPPPYPFRFCLVSYLFDFLFWLLWNFGFGFGYLTLGYLFNFQFWFL